MTYTDDDITDALRAAHADGVTGQPTYRAWWQTHRDRPSDGTIARRHGSWAAAWQAAGLQPNKRSRTVYTRRWTDDELAEWGRKARAATGGGGVRACEQWLKEQPGAPSLARIRQVHQWSTLTADSAAVTR